MKPSTDKDKIKQALERGVDKIYPSKAAFEEKLLSGDRITLYLGIDPTGFDLHIGHTVALRKLKHFQELGHRVILLIGDFTATIGDPTGKDKTRRPLEREEILANAKDYKKQSSKILDFKNKQNPIELMFNSKWLAKLTFEDVVKLASNFTVQQMIERDMFDRRIKAGKPVSLHEFMYPLMQGYDSVAMDVDLEVGGSDQTFNMLAGRTLQEKLNHREKFVLTVPLLADSAGNKIGKTAGNVIAINAEPNDLYGKIMSLGDDVIVKTFELCTDVDMEEVKDIEKQLKLGKNPRDYKARLAFEVVKMYNTESAAKKAEAEFKKIFANKDKPTDIPEQKVSDSKFQIIKLLTELKLSSSNSEAKRLVEQGGVRINDKKIDDWKKEIELKNGDVVQVGKRKFVKIKLT